jgi:hypothetical protein
VVRVVLEQSLEVLSLLRHVPQAIRADELAGTRVRRLDDSFPERAIVSPCPSQRADEVQKRLRVLSAQETAELRQREGLH